MTTLRDVSLADIARELHRRASHCPFCHGIGAVDNEQAAANEEVLLCSQCGGRRTWFDLEEVAARLEALTTGIISMGRHSWPVEFDDTLPDNYWGFRRDTTGKL